MQLIGAKPMREELQATAESEEEEGDATQTEAPPPEAAQPTKRIDQPLKEVSDDEEDGRAAQLEVIDRLTGTPVEADTLISAIAVCAPYNALASYTYKAKLTPGTMKKGKATQECFKMFLKETTNEAIRQQIRRVPVEDVTNALVGCVKIDIPGLKKFSTQTKMQKKSAKAALLAIAALDV
eukprot:Polyplicarium_translucidae@DN1507_c0_g1_i1.p2